MVHYTHKWPQVLHVTVSVLLHESAAIKPGSSFTSIFGCDSFTIMKSEPQKRTAISIKQKIDTPAWVDANKETHVTLAARLRIKLSTTNTSVINKKDIKKCYAQRSRFSGQRKPLKQSPLQELETLLVTWFTPARGNNEVINGTLLREKTLKQCHKVRLLMAGSTVLSCCAQNHSEKMWTLQQWGE